jgi:hypothetical protein
MKARKYDLMSFVHQATLKHVAKLHLASKTFRKRLFKSQWNSWIFLSRKSLRHSYRRKVVLADFDLRWSLFQCRLQPGELGSIFAQKHCCLC